MNALPGSTSAVHRNAVEAAVQAWRAALGLRLVSLVLFGSVARGTAREDSDIDVLVVAEGFPWSMRDRRRPLLQAWEQVRVARGLPFVEWNLVTKTPDEARVRVPLYLDLVEDAVILVDRDRFFAEVLDGMRQRMRAHTPLRISIPSGVRLHDGIFIVL